MKFSVTYPLINHPYDPAFLEKENILRFARAAEAAGYDGLGFTDHPAPTERWLRAGGHDALDPFAALAFCAAVTDHLRLIPHILVLPYRNPFLTAKSIATVDRLSGGRFILGTAIGYLKAEYKALGVTFDDRNEIFDECIEVMKGIWAEDDYCFESPRFVALGQTAGPKPVQRPHPPIWIGGNARRARRRVARYGQGWIPFPASATLSKTARTPALEGREQLAEMLDELWSYVDEAGRDRSEIDVHFAAHAGGAPGSDDFDANAHRDELDELAKLGVTWVGAGAPGDSIDHAIETLERYGAEVIAPMRAGS
ncbi:LLM class F420-dependent oxidoreductase [Myxococcota bacterium]|nr:LLM class F420-dependent oxidoreductase [Myxococcota bacterium]